MDRNKVGLRQRLLQRRQGDSTALGDRGVFRWVPRPGEHPQPERRTSGCDRLGARAEADQSQRLPRDAVHPRVVRADHWPRRIASNMKGKRRAQASNRENVCSACSFVQKSGMLATTIPCRVAARNVDLIRPRAQP